MIFRAVVSHFILSQTTNTSFTRLWDSRDTIWYHGFTDVTLKIVTGEGEKLVFPLKIRESKGLFSKTWTVVLEELYWNL